MVPPHCVLTHGTYRDVCQHACCFRAVPHATIHLLVRACRGKHFVLVASKVCLIIEQLLGSVVRAVSVYLVCHG